MGHFRRVVVPGVPHHVTQRGTRRLPVFFSSRDYISYLHLLASEALKSALAVWAYCLMPNHVHLIVVPSCEAGLSRPLKEVHRLHARRINREKGWSGHLWQERFSSAPMDEPHLLAALRYILFNPVRAGLVDTPTDWPYSSARAHLLGVPDPVVDASPVDGLVSAWDEFLRTDEPPETQALVKDNGVGRPLGSDRFLERLEVTLGRSLRPGRPGRKPEARRLDQA